MFNASFKYCKEYSLSFRIFSCIFEYWMGFNRSSVIVVVGNIYRFSLPSIFNNEGIRVLVDALFSFKNRGKA